MPVTLSDLFGDTGWEAELRDFRLALTPGEDEEEYDDADDDEDEDDFDDDDED